MQIRVIPIIFTVVFLSKNVLANDTIKVSNSKCKQIYENDYAVHHYNSACYEWQHQKNSYKLIQTREYDKYIREEDCCTPLTIALYDTLFVPNSFVFNSSTKIDSLFYATVTEIAKLPMFEWVEFEWVEENRMWIEKKDCQTITVPKSLFSLFSKTEQDSLHSIMIIDKTIDITDSLFEVYEKGYRYNEFPPIDILACLIKVTITQTPTGEYILSLNGTPYKMVKLSENHYVLRKERE